MGMSSPVLQEVNATVISTLTIYNKGVSGPYLNYSGSKGPLLANMKVITITK